MTETVDVRQLLTELYELLEGYAPAWYSEELHKRLLAALKSLNRKTRKKSGKRD